MKVGDNPAVINPNSILELESPNQGLLLPRIALVSTASTSPLTTHIAGMTVYNTSAQNDVMPGYYYNDGTKWVKLINMGNLSAPAFIGTNATNTFAITGLQNGNTQTDHVVTIDPVTGVLRKSPVSSMLKEEQMIHMAASGQTNFTTPMPITDIDKINVFRNGVRIGAVVVNPNTITLEAGVICEAGDEIRIVQIN